MAKRINDTHEQYQEKLDQWERCRDAFKGSDAVKRQKEKYLPKLPHQSDEEYAAYLMRALWYNVSGRTLDGLSGMAMATEPVITVPSSLDVFVDNSDLNGTPLIEFTEDVVENVLEVGRHGILVDCPVATNAMLGGADDDDTLPILTVQQAEELGIRPYIISYPAESIINWKTGAVNNHKELVQVVLQEEYETEDGKEDVQYRELRLEQAIAGFRYAQYIWRKDTTQVNVTDVQYVIVAGPIVPLINGKPLSSIPFWFANTEYASEDCNEPPMLDLVDVNLSHFRTSADLEHGLFWLAVPTPIFAGFSFEPDAVVKLGSMEGIRSTDPSAHAYFMEFGGKGLDELRKSLVDKESMMSHLGAKMLVEETKRVGESADALRIRTSGDASVLASITSAVSRLMSDIMRQVAQWFGVDDSVDVSIELNKDFTPNNITYQELTALTAALQSGALPKLDYFRLLQHGGIIAPDRMYEDFDLETDTMITNADMNSQQNDVTQPDNTGNSTGKGV